jgi:hypothetical protein
MDWSPDDAPARPRWMVCQYSRAGPVSSEKHETAPDAGVGGGDAAGVVPVTVVMSGYGPRPARLAVSSRMAKSTKSPRVRTLWRLYLCDALLKRLAQDLEDVTPALRACIPKEHPVVGQRPLARHRDLAAADPPHLRAGLVGACDTAAS